ncbi:MAG: hypothetical protein WCB11_14750 [Terriglobales bacterium]|jgi:plasmid maintenance system antidote protein VapI
MATRLARYFGTSEQFWLNLQDAFAVHQVKEKYAKELKAIKPLAAARYTARESHSTRFTAHTVR